MAEGPHTAAGTRYVFWNNKGGVGKTTLCFHSATHYAREHPELKILVVDMCPQSNVSLSLLTHYNRPPFASPPTQPRRSRGKTPSRQPVQEPSRKQPARSCRFTPYNASDPAGSSQTSQTSMPLFDPKVMQQGQETAATIAMSREIPSKTVVGYLQQELITPGRSDKKAESYFVVRVGKYNPSVEENLYLLCGDACLDLISKMLEHKRQGPPVPNILDPWGEVTTCLDKFITNFIEQSSGNWVVFIDTNPALTLYTEMALAAADRLIIPCSADVYSKHATAVLFWMIYGIESQSNPILDAATFSRLAERHQVKKPTVHIIVNNRATIHSTRAARAFSGVAGEIKRKAFSIYQTKNECFSGAHDVPLDFKQFEERYACETRDFHTTGVVSMHYGQPFYSMKKKKYDIGGLPAEVKAETLQGCEVAIASLVKMLD